MHLLPGELMFGVAPALMIDCARQIHDRDLYGKGRPFSVDEFSEALGAPVGESLPVLQHMLEEGFFEQVGHADARFLSTQKLAQLALAKISTGIPRYEADQLLRRIIDTATNINVKAGECDHSVACIVVFGSYLTNKSLMGDLDIGFALNGWRRHYEPARDGDIFEWQKRRDSSYSRTVRALRLRQPKKISLHALSEVIDLGTPYEIVFGVLPED